MVCKCRSSKEEIKHMVNEAEKYKGMFAKILNLGIVVKNRPGDKRGNFALTGGAKALRAPRMPNKEIPAQHPT
jgi:hypothetical protein